MNSIDFDLLIDLLFEYQKYTKSVYVKRLIANLVLYINKEM